jgi:hypothetical protein
VEHGALQGEGFMWLRSVVQHVQFVSVFMYDFVCYDLFHILLSCDKIMDPWNVCMYVCMHAGRWGGI